MGMMTHIVGALSAPTSICGCPVCVGSPGMMTHEWLVLSGHLQASGWMSSVCVCVCVGGGRGKERGLPRV